MKRQLKKVVCLALITSMILGQKTLKTTKNVTAKEKKDIKIAIDAGHQARGNFATEPVGPGSSTRKAKVAGGATGVASHVPEYKLTLAVSKKLQKELKARGYKVYMIRTKNNVNISNKKRAQLANKSGADIYIRIHADSSNSRAVTGASGLYPSKANRYVSKLSAKSKKLSSCLLKSYCKKTKIRNRGLVARDDLTGTNWSKISSVQHRNRRQAQRCSTGFHQLHHEL